MFYGMNRWTWSRRRAPTESKIRRRLINRWPAVNHPRSMCQMRSNTSTWDCSWTPDRESNWPRWSRGIRGTTSTKRRWMWSSDRSKPSVEWDLWRWALLGRSRAPPKRKKKSLLSKNYLNQLVNFNTHILKNPRIMILMELNTPGVPQRVLSFDSKSNWNSL